MSRFYRGPARFIDVNRPFSVGIIDHIPTHYDVRGGFNINLMIVLIAGCRASVFTVA